MKAVEAFAAEFDANSAAFAVLDTWFKGGAPADEQNLLSEGEHALQETPTQNFIHGIMPAHVLAQNQELAGGIENGRRVSRRYQIGIFVVGAL